MFPKILSLVSIALILGWMFYLLLGSVPLLILKHDDPSDSRLVRGFFDVHYRVLMVLASIGAISSIVAGRQILGLAFVCIAAVGFTARRLIVPRMDRLRSTVTALDAPAVRAFRGLHLKGLGLNVVLMAGFFTALNASSADIVRCFDVPPGCQGGACRVQCSLL